MCVAVSLVQFCFGPSTTVPTYRSDFVTCQRLSLLNRTLNLFFSLQPVPTLNAFEMGICGAQILKTQLFQCRGLTSSFSHEIRSRVLFLLKLLLRIPVL